MASEVHVVVLTGTGSAFSSGQDLKEMAQLVTGEATPEAAKGFRGLLDAVQSFEKPLARGGQRRRCRPRVHAAGALRSRVHGRRRPPACALRRAGCAAPRRRAAILFPRHDGVASVPPICCSRAPGWGRLTPSTPASRSRTSRRSRCWTRPWPSPRSSWRPPLERGHGEQAAVAGDRQAEVTAARDREDAAFVELLGSAANLAALERFGTTPLLSRLRGETGVRSWGRMTGRPRSGPLGSPRSGCPALVAQLDRASDYGSEGWGFESLQAR